MYQKNSHNYKVITIPGGTTEAENEPTVHIVGGGNSDLSLIIKYRMGESNAVGQKLYGQITFRTVLEYRWISDTIWYYPFGDSANFAFGLVEITKSSYKEDILSKNKYSGFTNARFGPGIEEAQVKHYRLSFDEYGYFDVIALNVNIAQIIE